MTIMLIQYLKNYGNIMKINYDEFEEIVRDYYDLKCKNEVYMDSIPYDIRQFVYDNTYNTNTQKQVEMLLEKLFGVDLYETFMWFLYNAPLKSKEDGGTLNVMCDGRYYYVHDINTFLNYVNIEYFSLKHS